MSDQAPSAGGSQTIAETLGADPAAAARSPLGGMTEPLDVGRIVRDLTRRHPIAMLAVAFVAGVAYVGRRGR